MIPEITMAATESTMLKPNMKASLNCSTAPMPIPTSRAMNVIRKPVVVDRNDATLLMMWPERSLNLGMAPNNARSRTLDASGLGRPGLEFADDLGRLGAVEVRRLLVGGLPRQLLGIGIGHRIDP